MYKLEYLPIARQDMINIVAYISGELGNASAAMKLANAFIVASEKIPKFPYAHAVYIPLKPLKKEYRRVVVQKYSIFYWVDERRKKVVVARVIYGKRNYEKVL